MIAFPSNQVFAIALLENNEHLIQKWAAQEKLIDEEDYRKVNNERGPSRGWGSAPAVRR